MAALISTCAWRGRRSRRRTWQLNLYTAPTPNYVPARLSVSDPLSGPGDGLNGEYWQRPPVSIPTDGATNPDNRIDVLIEGFGEPTGTFDASVLTHAGNDLTDVVTWLGADGASFTGTAGNLARRCIPFQRIHQRYRARSDTARHDLGRWLSHHDRRYRPRE